MTIIINLIIAVTFMHNQAYLINFERRQLEGEQKGLPG